MAKVDQIGFGGAGGDGDGGWWEALAGTAMMSGEGGGGRRPAGARAMGARAEGMHTRQTRLHTQSPGPSCLGGHWGSHGWAVVMRSGRASVGGETHNTVSSEAEHVMFGLMLLYLPHRRERERSAWVRARRGQVGWSGWVRD